eukprot:CAMPEP_0182458404 /NCGR_PEP_ID=MMETSP1319-20130603/3751_1 /TAXON_ID=172717 /ORGANISM="Bolidomonas pacifica, Strain RCC208" /LENGTH=617 /DNA_ID=CAMNT_0024657085 /DNA_START=30 /DNA_END=1879 /DNA_ORIENTATION=+
MSEISLSPGSPPTSEPVDSATGARLYEAYLQANVTYDPLAGGHVAAGEWAASKSDWGDAKLKSAFEMRLDAKDVGRGGEEATDDGGKDEGGAADNDATPKAPGGPPKAFPQDSLWYTGWFKMKQKSGSKKVNERQVALKFAPNADGTGHNVAGVGLNDFGRFKVVGTFFPLSETAGRMELYKWYTQMAAVAPKPKAVRKPKPKPAPRPLSPAGGGGAASGPRGPGGAPTLKRQPSGRAIKVPNKNFDASPTSKLSFEMSHMIKILESVKRLDYYQTFSVPVDAVALKLDDYHKIVTDPMDFSTLRARVMSGEVNTHPSFAYYMRLVFDNCRLYNKRPPDGRSPVLDACDKLGAKFEAEYEKFNRAAKAKEARAKEEEGRKIREEERRKQDEEGRKRQQAQGRGRADKQGRQRSDKGVKRSRDGGQSSNKRSRSGEASHPGSGGGGAGRQPAPPSSSQSAGMMRAMEDRMHEMAEMIRIQKEQLELVQRQAQANEAKLELSSMGMGGYGGGGPQPLALPPAPAPAYGGGGQQAMYHGQEIEEDEELTASQQDRLTRTINNLPKYRLSEVLRVIENDTGLDQVDDSMQIGVDELPNRTQVRLFDMLIRNPKATGGGRGA